MFVKTKQVAEMCGVSTFELRRVLRRMPRYDDGVQTHYIWDDVADAALLDEIKAKVAASKGVAKTQPTESEIRAEIARLSAALPQPVAAEPVAAEPVAAEPVAAEPVAAEPVAAEPVSDKAKRRK